MQVLPGRSIRLWSVIEIMELFDSRQLTLLFDLIRIHDSLCKKRKSEGETKPPNDEFQKEVAKTFGRAAEFCKKVGFTSAEAKIALTHVRLQGKTLMDYSALESELENAKEMLFHDHWNHSFVAVPPKYRNIVDKDDLFGLEVNAAFKSAVPDIKEAGNCLAVGCPTASVFHLMRAVEWGLRGLAAHLGKNSVRTHRSGKVNYKPLPYSDWEHILNQLGPLVDKRIEKMRPGPKKQAAQEFYYPALQDIRAIRDAWRNHVMHSRAEYSPQDAEAIRGHVERLLRTLATRIKEA